MLRAARGHHENSAVRRAGGYYRRGRDDSAERPPRCGSLRRGQESGPEGHSEGMDLFQSALLADARGHWRGRPCGSMDRRGPGAERCVPRGLSQGHVHLRRSGNRHGGASQELPTARPNYCGRNRRRQSSRSRELTASVKHKPAVDAVLISSPAVAAFSLCYLSSELCATTEWSKVV